MNLAIEFTITGYPPESIKTTDKIPDHYRQFVSNFAKPLLVTSPVIDILYHERSVKGCTLCNVIFNVRKTVKLQTRANEPFSAINSMLSGSMETNLKGSVIWLYQGQYSFFQTSMNEQELWIKPGFYEIQYCKYTYTMLNEFTGTSPLVHDWLERASAGEPPPQISGIISDELYQLHNQLKNSEIDSELREEWLYIKLRELLILLLEQQENKKLPGESKDAPLMNTIKAFVDNNLHKRKDLGLKELANAYNVSVSTLRRNIKSYWGMSYSEYLIARRMEKAHELMMNVKGKFNTTDIAYTVGYESAAAFIKLFKKKFGLTPREWISSQLIK